jgi:hypothetical protein
MKHLPPAVLVVLAAALSGAARAQTFTPQITQTVGAGSQESFFVLDFQDGSVDHNYAFGYFYDGAKTGADLISALSSGAGLGVTYLYNGGVVNGFSFNGHSEAGFGADGYWSYWLGTNGQTWKSSGAGIKSRPLSNGSWDGWSWDANSSDLPPVTPTTPAPVPEASTAASFGLLLALGAGGAALYARKKVRS